MRRNATSPIVVTSAHVHPEWTLELTGHNERGPRSRASKARESTSAQLARTIDFAEASSAANPADDDPVSPSKASSKAATAPGTMLRFMCGPPESANPKGKRGPPPAQSNRNFMPTRTGGPWAAWLEDCSRCTRLASLG